MNELKTITIDGVEYDFNALTNEQKAYVAQINDLSQKLGGLQMQAEQCAVAKDAFIQMLKAALAPQE
jgi:hypothetical protein